MTMTMAKAQEALKLFYLPGIQYQLNTANPVLAVIERDKTSVVGSEIRMALRFGRSGGVGNRADDGDLPIPNSRKTKQARWETKNIFARIAISDKTMKASRSKEGAFISLLEADLEDALADAKDNMARQVFGDGTGILTKTKANTGTTTIKVESVQYLAEGQFIDILDQNGNVKYSQREVLVVDDDPADPKITISGTNVDTVATDIITIHGNYMQELTGFGAVFKPDNVLYGIDRSVNKWFNPTVRPLNGPISEVAIQHQIDEVDRKAGGKTNFLLASYGVRRAYQELQLANKRITDVMKLEGGFEAISYNGIPFVVEKYAPAGTLYGLDLTTWRLYHIEDWNWLDEDGAILHRVSNKAIWEATLARYCDIGCSKPRGNWMMTGIEEAS
jgi:hypothetical protein